MKINYSINNIINSGISSETKLSDVRRIRIVNISCLIAIVLTPFIFLYNFAIGNHKEVYPLLFFSLMIVIGFILNSRHKNQWAAIFLILGGVVCSYWVTAIAHNQVGAPYFDILFGIVAIHLFEKKYMKILMGGLAFFSFIFLNYYQLAYRPFDLAEYALVFIMLAGVFLSIYHYNSEFEKNELIIKQQSEYLLSIQEEKHKSNLDLKQKDMDTFAANNRMQLQIRENIITQLGKIESENGSLKIIKSIRIDLLNQVETQRKLSFSEKNISDVNAQLYERLTDKHPNLSKKERELCSYIRLGLSTKEIASLMNTSDNTVYVTKNRLKAKLNLSTNTQVDTYLLNF